MQSKKPMTEAQKEKIQMAIKNRNDISDLIEDYDISNMYLAGAVIKRINRIQENLPNINFSRAIIGEEGKITNLSGCNLKGSNFLRAQFLGKVWFKGCDLRNCNFNGAWLPNAEYQFADMRNIQLCDAVIRIGSKNGFKAKLEWKIFELFAEYLEVEIIK